MSQSYDRSDQPNPLVSVITPSFNSSRYLRATLDSVATQTYSPIEHIIVDGGSTDDTLRIVGEFPKARLFTGSDSGMYDAINQGMRSASGEITAYLNSDDLYFSDTVERVVRYFTTHPRIDLVFGNCLYVDQDGEILFIRKYPRFKWRMYAVLDGSTMPQQSCFWRRSILERVGYFDTSFKMAGDFEFFIRAGKTAGIGKVTGRPLAQFRFHEGMQTLSRKSLNDAEISRIHSMYPVFPSWALPVTRTLATLRYKCVNVHRIGDKLRNRLLGRITTYHP